MDEGGLRIQLERSLYTPNLQGTWYGNILIVSGYLIDIFRQHTISRHWLAQLLSGHGSPTNLDEWWITIYQPTIIITSARSLRAIRMVLSHGLLTLTIRPS